MSQPTRSLAQSLRRALPGFLLPLAAACGALFAPAAQAQEEEKVLNVYNWAEYIGENTIFRSLPMGADPLSPLPPEPPLLLSSSSSSSPESEDEHAARESTTEHENRIVAKVNVRRMNTMTRHLQIAGRP